MMKVSIIVPVYNVERYLRACLDSIAELRAFSWEAILVDDGSTDASGAICDEYAARDPRFKVIHQQNAGVSAARNAGLRRAQGEWIWFVDSDDTINPDFEIAHPEAMERADYVLFDLRTFRDGEAAEALAHQVGTVADERLGKNDFLCKWHCNHHQRLFYRKDVGDGCPPPTIFFSPNIRVGEDLEFQYKYLTRCRRPVRLNAVLYNYRLRPGSATQGLAYRQKNVEDLPKVLDHLLAWCREERTKAEPWLEVRIQQMFQNLLYSASLVGDVDRRSLQATIRRLLDAYLGLGFSFPRSAKMKLAHWSVGAYFVLNRVYLRVKGLS